MSEPANGYAFRVASLERRLARLEDLEPAVVKAQLQDVKEDIHQLSSDLAAIRKILTGFLVSFAFAAVTTVVAIVALTQGHG